MRFSGLRMDHFLEPKPGIPPTPKQIEFLERRIREHRVAAIAYNSYAPRAPAETLAKRAGARLVTLCQNVRETKECADYIAMVDHNVGQLTAALEGGVGP
jgi:ABC-type Zn uptake system ZnuABC Zn-binding protein ZnuA